MNFKHLTTFGYIIKHLSSINKTLEIEESCKINQMSVTMKSENFKACFEFFFFQKHEKTAKRWIEKVEWEARNVPPRASLQRAGGAAVNATVTWMCVLTNGTRSGQSARAHREIRPEARHYNYVILPFSFISSHFLDQSFEGSCSWADKIKVFFFSPSKSNLET